MLHSLGPAPTRHDHVVPPASMLADIEDLNHNLEARVAVRVDSCSLSKLSPWTSTSLGSGGLASITARRCTLLLEHSNV